RNDTRRDDAVLGRLQNLNRLGAGEVLGLLGHPRHHPLARKCVTDEDDASVVARYTRTAVCGRTDLEPDNGADQAHAAGGFAAGGFASGRAPSSCSVTPIDDLSCHGTLTTMSPGVNNSRPF